MMPVADNIQVDLVDYKKKYRAIKKKLKLLLYEHECFLEELRKSQRKLLKVSRDRSFLLDRLMQYENIDDSSSDSDLTASSDSETEARESAPTKRKMSAGLLPMYGENLTLAEAMGYTGAPGNPQQALQQMAQQQQQQQQQAGAKSTQPPKKKAKISKQTKTTPSKQSASAASVAGLMAAAAAAAAASSGGRQLQHPAVPTTMTREELERHLEFKQSIKPQYMSLGQAMNTLPDDIFGNEDSNQGLPVMGMIEIKHEDDEDSEHLIMDAN